MLISTALYLFHVFFDPVSPLSALGVLCCWFDSLLFISLSTMSPEVWHQAYAQTSLASNASIRPRPIYFFSL